MTASETYCCSICRSTDVDAIYKLPGYPICGGPVLDAERAASIPRDDIVLGFCRQCGSSSLVAPSADDLAARLYDDTYTSSNMSVAMGAEVDSKRLRYVDMVNGLGIPAGGSIMEIGCYDGSLLAEFRDLGFSVTGCEPSPVASIAKEKYGLDIRNALFSSDLFQPHEFDLVLIRNVLEHIPDPARFMTDVARTMKPGAAVAIAVPDGHQRIAEAILGSFVPEHPNYFGSDSLLMVLEAAGFEQIETETKRGLLHATARNGTTDVSERPFSLNLPSQSQIASLRSAYEAGVALSRKRYDTMASLIDSALPPDLNLLLFGANTHALELLSAGAVPVERLAYAVDDGPLKWGKHLVSFDVPVKPREALDDAGEYALVICSYYSHDDIISSVMTRPNPPRYVLRSYPEVSLVATEQIAG